MISEPEPHRRSLYAAALAVAGLLGGFGLLADEVIEGDTLDFDKAVLMALRTPGDPATPIGPGWLTEAVRDVTSLGSFSVLAILVALITGYLFLAGKARTSWFLLAAVLSGTAISTLLKSVFDRSRPDLTGIVEVFTKSFPSGHATVSAVVFLTVGALLASAARERRLRVFYLGSAIALTVLVGLSRVYLGVHYPTDVLAGWSLGAAWAIVCWVVLRLAFAPRPPS